MMSAAGRLRFLIIHFGEQHEQCPQPEDPEA